MPAFSGMRFKEPPSNFREIYPPWLIGKPTIWDKLFGHTHRIGTLMTGGIYTAQLTPDGMERMVFIPKEKGTFWFCGGCQADWEEVS